MHTVLAPMEKYLTTIQVDTLTEAQFIQANIELYKHRNDLLTKLLYAVSKGKLIEYHVAKAFKELEKINTNPVRAVKAVLDFGLPASSFRKFASFNKYQNTDNEWERTKIYNVPVPKQWCSYNEYWKLWASLRDSLAISEVVGCPVEAASWKIDTWLEFILSNSFFSKYIPAGTTHLELILRGDGFLGGGSHRTFLLGTLGNFGLLSKCLLFNSVLNVCQCEDKDSDTIATAWKYVSQRKPPQHNTYTIQRKLGYCE